MTDYIKREDAIRSIADHDEFNGERWIKEAWADYLIEDAKSADVVPVVRCKDCKHCEYASNRIPTEQAWVCYKWGVEVEQDGFCAVGERQDNE